MAVSPGGNDGIGFWRAHKGKSVPASESSVNLPHARPTMPLYSSQITGTRIARHGLHQCRRLLRILVQRHQRQNLRPEAPPRRGRPRARQWRPSPCSAGKVAVRQHDPHRHGPSPAEHLQKLRTDDFPNIFQHAFPPFRYPWAHLFTARMTFVARMAAVTR